MDQRLAVNGAGQEVLETAGEMKRLLLRDAVDAGEQLLGAAPADFDAAEQIGFGSRHFEDALRLERHFGPENLRVGLEAQLGTTTVENATELLELCLRLSAFEHLSIELLSACHLDVQAFRQRVHDRDADAMQAA